MTDLREKWSPVGWLTSLQGRRQCKNCEISERLMTARRVRRVWLGLQYEQGCVQCIINLSSVPAGLTCSRRSHLKLHFHLWGSFIKKLFWCVTLAFTSTCSELSVDEWVSLMLFCPGSMSSSSWLIFVPFRRDMNPRLRHLTDRPAIKDLLQDSPMSAFQAACVWVCMILYICKRHTVLTRIVRDFKTDLCLHK